MERPKRPKRLHYVYFVDQLSPFELEQWLAPRPHEHCRTHWLFGQLFLCASTILPAIDILLCWQPTTLNGKYPTRHSGNVGVPLFISFPPFKLVIPLVPYIHRPELRHNLIVVTILKRIAIKYRLHKINTTWNGRLGQIVGISRFMLTCRRNHNISA